MSHRLPSPRIAALGVAFLLFLLYRLTAAPTFGFIDEGELAAAASTFGITHPTGYPTFTILGGVVTMLPWRDITELIILASLLTALGAGLVVLVAHHLLGRVLAKESDGATSRSRLVMSVIAGLLVGATGLWWMQGTGFEVYALHALMLPLVTLLFLQWIAFEEGGGAEDVAKKGVIGVTGPAFLFSMTLGLAFTNHMTTILLAPAFLFLFFARIGWRPESLRRLVGLLPGFLLGLLPYLYIPLRAATDPRLNWSNPQDWWGFSRHLTGAQYGDWMFTSAETFGAHSSYIGHLVATEMLLIGPILALAGIARLLRHRPKGLAVVLPLFVLTLCMLLVETTSVAGIVVPFILLTGLLVVLGLRFGGTGVVEKSEKKKSASRLPLGKPDRSTTLALFLLLVILATALYAGGYDIYDIEAYYLAAIMAIGLLAAFGLLWLVERTSLAVGGGGGLALVTAMILIGYGDRDRSDLYLVEDAAATMLESVPEKTVIFSGLWDFWLSGSWYLQAAEGVRRDVAVLDYNLMKYGWYLRQLTVNHPALMASAAHAVDRFREVGDRFERGLPYDNREIDERYVAMIDALVEGALAADRPVLFTFDANVRSGNGYRYADAYRPPQRRVPYELGYLINPSGAYVPQPFPSWQFRPNDTWSPDGHKASLFQWYASSARDRASYEMVFGNDSLAGAYIDYALVFDPGWESSERGRLPRGMAERIDEMTTSFARIRQMQR